MLLRSPKLALLLAAGLLLALAPFAEAQDDVAALERAFTDLAPRLVERTVLVRATGQGKVGYGSGAVLSEDGWILTCAHVVDFADELEVTLHDGRAFSAERKGMNPRQDYALLKAKNASGLASFEIGDSRTVALGQWVAACGHPGGPYPDLKPAFSVGRVTGLHRRLPVQMMDRYYDDAIRTDAPIFAGNSGGPLVDLEGRLIGINGAILLLNENSYAVPIHAVARDMDRLKAGVRIEGRPPSGALPLPIDEFQGRDLTRFIGRFVRRALGKGGLGGYFRGPDGKPTELSRMVEQLGRTLEDEEAIQKLVDAFAGNAGEGDVESLRKTLDALLGPDADSDPARRLLRELDRLFAQEPGDPQTDADQVMRDVLKGLLGGGDSPGQELLERLFEDFISPDEPPSPRRIERTLETMSSRELKELLETTDAQTLRRMASELGPDRVEALLQKLHPDDLGALLAGPRGQELQALLAELKARSGGAPAPARPVTPAPAPARPRAFLGIDVDQGSEAEKRGEGIRLYGVVADGPADRAGLRTGDIITRIGSHEIHRLDDLADALSSRRPGQDVLVTVRRDDPDAPPGELRGVIVRVTLGDREGR